MEAFSCPTIESQGGKYAVQTNQTPTENEEKVKFLVAGLLVSGEFQKCQALVLNLFDRFPEKFAEPDIRPMLNVDWEAFALKMKRRHGGELWKSKSPVMVFLNGVPFGDESTLIDYISQTYLFSLSENYTCLGEIQLENYFKTMQKKGRRYVTLNFCKYNSERTYSILIMLYFDLVPKTCKYFLDRCKGSYGGWTKTTIIRVVPQSWIQFKGKVGEGPQEMECENYKISHDRRGILSTCNYRKQLCSTNQFNICLDATPWMDRRYVAFGLVVQGEEVLREFETLKVSEDNVPESKIEIYETNEFQTTPMDIDDPYLVKRTTSIYDITFSAQADADSVVSKSKYERGMYSMTSDLRSYMPFLHLPDFLLAYLKKQEPPEEEVYEPDTDSLTLLTDDSSESAPGEELGEYVKKSKDFLLKHNT